MKLFQPIHASQAVNRFDKYFTQFSRNGHNQPGIQIRVYSEKLGLDYHFGTEPIDRPYHIASIGKVFTATLIEIFAERGILSTSDPIARFFSAAELNRLFVFNDTDYAKDITILHLLGHTSGIADYFEGAVVSGNTFLKRVLAERDEHWTPAKLVDFTRTNQKAVGKPGTVFNYSDTGYILLGQIIEKASGKSFDQNLHDEIFTPLEMNDSYLMFYSEPKSAPRKTIEEIWIEGIEVSRFQSLSCDWAGGGIVSTTGDLLKFHRALNSGRLIRQSTLQPMQVCPNKFRSGIYYGLGMMELHLEDFFFLLRGFPRLKGHIGVLATHMFYDPTNDTYIIMNFGDNTRMVDSFKALIEIESTLKRMH